MAVRHPNFIRSVLSLLVITLCITGIASAWEETFQGKTSFSYSVTDDMSGTIQTSNFTEYRNFSMDGFYCTQYTSAHGIVYINPTSPAASDYFAFTPLYYNGGIGTGIPNNGDIYINFYKSDGTYLAQTSNLRSAIYSAIQGGNARIELIRDSSNGAEYLYINGVNQGTVAYTASRPGIYAFQFSFNSGYYICANGKFVIDDIIQLSSSSGKIVGAIPADWYLMKDTLGGQVPGLYNQNNVSVRTTYFNVTYAGKTNLDGQYLYLLDTDTSTIRESVLLHGYSGLAKFNLTQFTASGAPFGQYKIAFEGLSVYDTLWYVGYGAAMSWGEDQYLSGENAVISYAITDAYYTTDFTYKIATLDIYGDFKTNTTLTAKSGQVTVALDSTTYPAGVYYAELIATDKVTGAETIMAYDATEVSEFVSFYGYVHDGATALVLPDATINITQSSVTTPYLSATDGNYTSSSSYIIGQSTTFDVSKTGYISYTKTFTPLVNGNILVNFTLIPSSPTITGLAIGGVVRDKAYGNPIPDATVIVSNATHSESYTTASNAVGFYLLDESDGATLVNNRWYNVVGSKLGYGSQSYFMQVAVGAGDGL